MFIEVGYVSNWRMEMKFLIGAFAGIGVGFTLIIIHWLLCDWWDKLKDHITRNVFNQLCALDRRVVELEEKEKKVCLISNHQKKTH